MRTLVTLALSFVFLFVSQWVTYGQDIKLAETIKIDRGENLQIIPKSFCVDEEKMFFFPDQEKGRIKIFEKSLEGSLKFSASADTKEAEFTQPRNCFYSQNEGKLAVLDYLYNGGSIFILERSGKINFKTIKTFSCPRFGYDMEFTGDGKQLIVSGSIADKENISWALYSVDVEKKENDITYLLPSYKKYGLANSYDYWNEYKGKQTIPATGVKAYIGINGDDLFMVWEGALRIIHFDLSSQKIQRVFGEETSHYKKPDGTVLAGTYRRGDFIATWKAQGNYSYITKVFATTRNVFLIYETAKNTSIFRMQTYTPEGKFLTDVAIPGTPDRQMWLNKENPKKLYLYAFAKNSGSDGNPFSILKYKINVK